MEKTSRPFPLFLLLPPGLGGDKSGLIGVEGGLPLGGPGDQSASPPPLFNILLQGWSPETCPRPARKPGWRRGFCSFCSFLQEEQKWKQQNTRELGQRGKEGRKHAPKSLMLPGCNDGALAQRSLSRDRNVRHPMLEEE